MLLGWGSALRALLHSMAWHSMLWCSCHGMAWHAQHRKSTIPRAAWHGMAWHGMGRHGAVAAAHHSRKPLSHVSFEGQSAHSPQSSMLAASPRDNTQLLLNSSLLCMRSG